MSPQRILSTILLLLLSFSARADWGVVGAATRCNEAQGSFVIAPVVELSSADKAAVPVKEGFSKIPLGAHELRCMLKATAIVAKLRVYPSDAGACMGSGYVSIDSLAVGSSMVIHHPTAFNWQCRDEEILTRIEVAVVASGLSVTTCTAKNWEWGIGFSGIKCNTKGVPANNSFEADGSASWELNGFALNLPRGFSRVYVSDAFQLISAEGVGLTLDSIPASNDVPPSQQINKWTTYAETDLPHIAGRHGRVTIPLRKEILPSGSILYTLGESSASATNGNRFGLFFVIVSPSGDLAQIVFEGPGAPDMALSKFRPYVVSAGWNYAPNKSSKRTR